MQRRELIKTAFALPFAAMMFLSAVVGASGFDFSDAFCYAVSGNALPETGYIGELLWGTAPVVLFAALYSLGMYRDLMLGGVYRVVRYQSRMRWYFHKAGEVVLCALSFFSLYFLSGSAVLICADAQTELADIYLVSACAVIYAFVSAFFVLAANLAAIRIGSAPALASVFCILSLLVFAACFYTRDRFGILFKLNPVCALIPNWHTPGALIAVKNFSLMFSAVYSVGLFLSAFAVGAAVISKSDLFIKSAH